MVEVTRLELTTSWSRTKRATNCATPRLLCYYIILFVKYQLILSKNCKYFVGRRNLRLIANVKRLKICDFNL